MFHGTRVLPSIQGNGARIRAASSPEVKHRADRRKGPGRWVSRMWTGFSRATDGSPGLTSRSLYAAEPGSVRFLPPGSAREGLRRVSPALKGRETMSPDRILRHLTRRTYSNLLQLETRTLDCMCA